MLSDGSWGRYHGPHCDALRIALAEYHGVEHVVLCCSGTAAVELALRSVPVGPGDEVILSAYDFKANFVNVLTVGAIPVLIDTLPHLPAMDIHQLSSACTDRTRAILVSHLHGSLAPMSGISEFARSRNIAVIEDACQAPGAMIGGRRAGSLGDIGVLSFGGSKLLTSGRGGALLTLNDAMAQRIKLFTQRGNDAYPLSEMQAAVLLPQLKQLDARNQHRFENAVRLQTEFLSSDVLKPAISPLLSGDDSGQKPAFYKLAFRLADKFSDRQRELFCESAREVGVPLDPGFHALHRIHSQRRFRSVGELPNATSTHDRMMILHHTGLGGDEAEILSVIKRLQVVVSSMRPE
jgi:dTDP-4-amino-4,6-dideoxygalactose transaminase